MRSEEISVWASSASLCSRAVSSAGGAQVYVAWYCSIWARNVGRSNGWCCTSSPPTVSQGRNMPLMPAMFTIGNGLSSTSSAVSSGPSTVPLRMDIQS